MDLNLHIVIFGYQEGSSSTLEDAQVTLSPGFRFAPKDEELVNYYLKKKISNERIPHTPILTVNVYGHSPTNLTELYPSLEDGEWYFFTPRNRWDLFWKLPNRVAGKGYWKAHGAEKQIYHNNVCIGSRKSLIFYEGKHPKGKKTDWVMKEYEVDQPTKQEKDADNNLLGDCVLSVIKKKESSSCCKVQSLAESKKQKTISW